jgi:adenylate cyclase
MSSAPRTTLRHLWWAPLVCFGGAWLLSLTPFAQQLEWRTLDWRTALRAYYQKAPDPRIAIVLYGDETNDASNLLQWPPDRGVHGELIADIAIGRPKVITYDVIVDASREGDGDAKMAASVQQAAQDGVKVVSASVTSAEPGVPAPGQEGPTEPLKNVEGDINRLLGDKDAIRPFPLLRAVSRYGFADTPQGSDGVQREIPVAVRVGQQVYPSLALQTLMTYLDVPADKVRVRLGDAVYLETKERRWRLPIDHDGRFLLNYRYDRDEHGDDFATYSVIQVLVTTNDYYVEKKKFAPKPPPFAGRIVLLGQAVTGKADAGATPRSGLSPLVLVHANLLNNVLADDFAHRVPDWLVWATAGLLAYSGLVVLAHRSVIVLGGGAVFGVVSYAGLALWSWVWFSWWFPLTAPLAGFAALQFIVIGHRVIQEQRQKQEIKGMFGSYLSPVIVERMVKTRELPLLGGHLEDITAYFSDIQGYSTFSEKLTPKELVELLNTYLTACTDIIQEEGGTLDKYIGDAVVAMFGAPIALPDHAYRACVAALRVQAKLDELRLAWDAAGERWPDGVRKMRSRIGLNSGSATIGNMGSRTRFSYTMTGDNVNLAARMESGAKTWGAYTMCTEATRRACEQHGGDRVVFRPLGRIVVMGRSQFTLIHEAVGLKADVTAPTLECVDLFAQGLEKYYARDWEGAHELFRRSAKLEPHQPGTPGIKSNPSRIYLDIVEEYKTEPPPDNWDGVRRMTDK